MSVPSFANLQEIMTKTFLLYLCLSLTQLTFASGVSVIEVPAGHLAELPCLSSDDNHRFMFWQLTDDRHIIGPGNSIDEEKYNYEVLTGKLFIRGVSTAEEGFYRCVARGVEDNAAIKVHIVELIVKKDPLALTENPLEKNLLRGMAATMVIVVAIAVTLLILILKQKKSQRFFDMEESRENSPAKYVGHVQSAPVTPAPRIIESTSGIDNMGLDVDFPKVFQQMQKGQTLPL